MYEDLCTFECGDGFDTHANNVYTCGFDEQYERIGVTNDDTAQCAESNCYQIPNIENGMKLSSCVGLNHLTGIGTMYKAEHFEEHFPAEQDMIFVHLTASGAFDIKGGRESCNGRSCQNSQVVS